MNVKLAYDMGYLSAVAAANRQVKKAQMTVQPPPSGIDGDPDAIRSYQQHQGALEKEKARRMHNGDLYMLDDAKWLPPHGVGRVSGRGIGPLLGSKPAAPSPSLEDALNNAKWLPHGLDRRLGRIVRPFLDRFGTQARAQH